MHADPAPTALLNYWKGSAAMASGRRRLVLVLPQLGDFDSLEYAQAIVTALPQLKSAGIALLAVGIGHEAGADRFCQYTGFPAESLRVESQPVLHRELGLYSGLVDAGGPWPGLLLMCAGIGSPGTLQEVWRGYCGDRSASQRLTNPLFNLAGGQGFLRPFELATIRLANMREVLSHWRTYVPCDDFLTQRGGTFFLDRDDSLLYCHRDRGLLGFSDTMAKPLQFLDPWLTPTSTNP